MQPDILQQLYKKWQVLNFLKSQKGDITFRAYVLVYIKQMLNIINISDIVMAMVITKEVNMALNYNPLWIQLAKKGLKKTDVIAMAGLTTNVMA